jgi:hypothetical protein
LFKIFDNKFFKILKQQLKQKNPGMKIKFRNTKM